MIVKITYDDKRLDVFDTATFTAPSALGKQNMLTNFEVRFDDMEGSGLWAAAHSYRIDESFKGDASGDEAPVARRTKGWRFLLASAKELDHVELVVVDGEAILKRVCGELVDLQAFDEKAYECIGASSKGLHERIVELRTYLARTSGDADPAIPGIPPEVVAKLIAMSAALDSAEDEEAEEWGDLDEAGW